MSDAETLFQPDEGTRLDVGQTFRHRPSDKTVTVVAVDHEHNPFNRLRETWVTVRFPDGRTHALQFPDEIGSVLVPFDG